MTGGVVIVDADGAPNFIPANEDDPVAGAETVDVTGVVETAGTPNFILPNAGVPVAGEAENENPVVRGADVVAGVVLKPAGAEAPTGVDGMPNLI